MRNFLKAIALTVILCAPFAVVVLATTMENETKIETRQNAKPKFNNNTIFNK